MKLEWVVKENRGLDLYSSCGRYMLFSCPLKGQTFYEVLFKNGDGWSVVIEAPEITLTKEEAMEYCQRDSDSF